MKATKKITTNVRNGRNHKGLGKGKQGGNIESKIGKKVR